jgi:2-polyprenyl-3-methyl-5-hydroxy-6-metoxy-1,4-benzoquinol methylase
MELLQMGANPVVCPACLSTDTSLKIRFSAEQAAQHFVQAKEYPDINLKLRSHIERLWNGTSCDIESCTNCGFGFSWPFIAGDDVFYNLAYPHVGYPTAKWEFERTLQVLKGLNLSSKRMLEVGAGFGFFLDRLCKDGATPSNIEAIEYNQDAIKHLRQRGYATISDDVRSPSFEGKVFDNIFLFHVVEHMDQLDILFSRLRALVDPAGSIFIAVPNVKRTDYQESHDLLLDTPPNHIGRWTTRAFKEIASRHSLSVADAETEPFDVGLFLKTDLVYSHRRRAQEFPSSLSGRARSMPRGPLRTAIEVATIAANAPARIPHWWSAYADRRSLGQSLWVRLRPA